jgi:hypothetical protein
LGGRCVGAGAGAVIDLDEYQLNTVSDSDAHTNPRAYE